MNSRYCELRLEDMLADSIVRALMEADGVDPRELEAQLRRTAALLRPARLSTTGPCGPQKVPDLMRSADGSNLGHVVSR
jgi:hypothetical protein